MTLADQDVGMDVCANFGDSRMNPSDASFSAVFRTSIYNFRLEVYSGVISGVFVDRTGRKVPVKLGDSRSKRPRDIRLPHFVTNDDDDNNDAGRRTLSAFCLKLLNF